MKNSTKPEPKLKRTLGAFTATMLVIGLAIGTGVFKKIVPMAQTGLSETAILMAWAVAGLISLIGVYTASALATLTDDSGGLYEYVRIAYGNFLSFLTGWSLGFIMNTAAMAAICFLFVDIVNSFIPIPNPLESWADVSVGQYFKPFKDSGMKLLGIATMAVLTGVNMLGSKESGILNNIITSLKILGVIGLILTGLFYTPPAREIISNAPVPSPTGISYYSLFLSAMLSAFWGYDGWYVAPNIAGEMINPKRDLPIAMTFGIVIVAVLYITINHVYFHVMSLDQLAALSENQIGAAVVAKTILGTRGETIFLVIILACVLGTLNGNVVATPRQFYRMAEEGWLFSHLNKVHPRFRTPHVAFYYSFIISCILLISGSFDRLSDLVIFLSFMIFGLMALAVIKLRRNGTLTSKIIGYPVAQTFLVFFSVVFTFNTFWTQPLQSLLGLGLILSGVPVYFYFKKRRST